MKCDYLWVPEVDMHRSRLCAVVIDCNGGELERAATFWGQALGKKVDAAKIDATRYRELLTRDDELILLVQQVDHPSRVHLDIETDDIDAEVLRLEALGAKRVENVKTWWVMEAPTGQRFCVVKPQRGPLEGKANTWGEASAAVANGNACPKCRPEPMQEEVFEGIAIDRCPVCKGIFLEAQELESLLAKNLAHKVDAFAFSATSDAMDTVHGTCPRCERAMEASVGPEGIRVDRCPQCRSFFLEQGELATLQLAKG